MGLSLTTLTFPLKSQRMQKIFLPIALLLVVGLVAGCVSLSRPMQNQRDNWLAVPPGGSVGQTFVAKYDGLSGVYANFRSEQPVSGELLLRLYSLMPEPRLVEEIPLELPADGVTGRRTFAFDALPESGNQAYQIEIVFLGQGSLEIGAAGGDTYLNGAGYVNGAAQEMQLSFGLRYWTPLMILGLAVEWLQWVLYLLAAGVLFLLPGWVIMDLVWHNWRDLNVGVMLGVSCSVGLAVYPVLFLWVHLFQLEPGLLLALLPPAISIGIIVWRYRGLPRFSLRLARPHYRDPAADHGIDLLPGRIYGFLLVVVLLLAAFAQFWAVRMLQVPNWGDSVQHTVMAQLMLDHGGLFSNWQPYAPYESLTVHYGFSSAVAVVAWLTGITAEQAVLFTGQAMIMMSVLAVFPLAYWASYGNRWAGLGALLVAGLLLPIPGLYANWGRYAQLTGQVILPGILWMTVTLFDKPRAFQKRTFSMAALTGLVLTGMALSYYRMPIYYALFVAAWLVFWVFLRENRSLLAYKNLLVVLGVTFIFTILLFLPWIPRLLGSTLGEFVSTGVVQATELELRLNDFSTWQFLPDYVPYPYVILAFLGAGWGVLSRRWRVVVVLLWVGFLIAYFFGGLVRLPAANMLQTFAILIMLYIPVGILCGFLIGELIGWHHNLSPRWGLLIICMAIFILALWGGMQQARLIDPMTYTLFTQPDRRAMEWIQKNIADEARFLVEGFTIYEGWTSVGSDGGWWLPLLGGRQNTMPPQYALINERPIEPDYSSQVTELVALLESQPVASPQVIMTLCAQEITHIYIGQRQGEVGVNARQLFAPQDLLDASAFDLVYHHDRVYIFGLKPQACQPTP